MRRGEVWWAELALKEESPVERLPSKQLLTLRAKESSTPDSSLELPTLQKLTPQNQKCSLSIVIYGQYFWAGQWFSTLL